MKLFLLESKIFGKVCYGFRRDGNKRVETVPQEAEIVQVIFALCLAGNSLEKIQKHLRKQGILSPSGRTVWSRDVLNKLLKIVLHQLMTPKNFPTFSHFLNPQPLTLHQTPICNP